MSDIPVSKLWSCETLAAGVQHVAEKSLGMSEQDELMLMKELEDTVLLG